MLKARVSLLLLFLLQACHTQENQITTLPQDVVGVFSGVTLDAQGSPLKIKATVRQGVRTLVTFWDSRDRQGSNNATYDVQDQRLSFVNEGITYQCATDKIDWECHSAFGTFTLQYENQILDELESIAGIYHAQVDNNIYTMQVENTNQVVIKSGSCQAKGELEEDANVGVTILNIQKNSCDFGELNAYLHYVTDNENLHSLQFESDNYSFPQIWIKS